MLRLHQIFVEVNEKLENILRRPNFARLHKNRKRVFPRKRISGLLNSAISYVLYKIL